MGGICPMGGTLTPIPAGVTNPSPPPQIPPKTLPPFLPSGWLVGVVAKYKSSGRSLKSCWHQGRGPGCLSFSPLSFLLSPPGAAVSPPPPPPAHLSVTWFCEEGEGADAGAEGAGAGAGGGAGLQRISDRSSMIQVSLGSTRLNSLTKTMKCAYRVFKWPCRSRATVSLKCAQ